MYAHFQSRTRRCAILATIIGTFAMPIGVVTAQQGVEYHVDSSNQRLEMVVNTSRILTVDEEVPRMLVNNEEVLRVVPLSPNKIQVSALKPGVTQVNLWHSSGDVKMVDVVVFADARQLELVLQSEFPSAAIRVRPLASSVVLTGYVDRPETVSRVISIAEDYYPKVINNISVGGVQQITLHVKVMEVSRTKLRKFGMDWAMFFGDDHIISSAAGIISAASSGAAGVATTGAETLEFGIINGGNQIFGFIEALRQYDFLKILAEPTLTTVSGRPAMFNEGGQFPILIPQSLGVNTIEYKEFGTRVDFVPIVLGNGNIRLDVRPEVSEIDNSRGVDIDGTIVPGLRTRWVDTAVEMRAGQTLALAGLIQQRVDASNRGLPWLADLPWAGNLFRRQEDNFNEIELLVMVRPELVAALEPHQVPKIGPGDSTAIPCDADLLGRGYLEVPRCCDEPRCAGPQRSANPYQNYNNRGPAPNGGMGPNGMGPNGMGPNGMGPNGMGVEGGDAMNFMQPSTGYESSGAAPSMQPADGGGQFHGVVPESGGQPGMFGPSGYDSLEF